MLNRKRCFAKAVFYLQLTLLTAAAYGASSDDGQVILTGHVVAANSLTIHPEPAARNLDILKGEERLTIAFVRERSNSEAGYKIAVSSARNGRLMHEKFDTEALHYLISYDRQPFVSPTSVPTIIKQTKALSESVSTLSAVEITFKGKADALAGTYTDTLTFEISAP